MLGFSRNHLEPSKMRSQAYDETSNMSGKANGAASRISSQYPFTLYTHCTVHCLSLAVVASFVELSVRNMIGVVKWLSNFFWHTSSIRWSWKKLHGMPSQNWTCWSSNISSEQDELNGSTLSILSRNLTPPLLLVCRQSSSYSDVCSKFITTFFYIKEKNC